jgi:type VI secretion system ImpM family protein
MTLFEGPILAVGKIAGEAEYLRAETEAGALFDAWLDESFEAALERWGSDSRAALRTGSPHAFLWWPRGAERFDGPLCGVLAPSRDAVGRDYPLAVFARVDTVAAARSPHTLLLALGEFLDEAWRIVDVARRTPLTRSELALGLRQLPAPDDDVAVRAMDEYAEWCRTVRLSDGWNAVAPASIKHADDVLLAIGQGWKDGLLRLPVGNGGAGAVTLWLDIVCRVMGHAEARFSAFWSADDRALVVARGAPPVSIVEALWTRYPQPLDTSVLVGAGQDRSTFSPEGGELSMAEFLESLGENACPPTYDPRLGVSVTARSVQGDKGGQERNGT